MTDHPADHRLQRLRARYADSLAFKREALEGAWRAFAAAPTDTALRTELALQVHRLCGSAAAYGYVELGEHACAADRLLSVSPPSLLDALAAPLRALLDALEQAMRIVCVTPLPVNATTLRVVLVEDDPAQATLMARQLEARGCAVRTEGSGDDLWSVLALWPCHAVVLDYWLCGETAAEIAVVLRREPAFARIALLCCSVERDAQVLRAATEAGCDAVVSKHDGIGRLFEAICACVAWPHRCGTDFRVPS